MAAPKGNFHAESLASVSVAKLTSFATSLGVSTARLKTETSMADDLPMVETASDVSEVDAINLEDADWGLDPLLRFVDRRIEGRYLQSMCSRRHKLGVVIIAFYTMFALADSCSKTTWSRYGSSDPALLVTAAARSVQFIFYLGATIVLIMRRASVETVFVSLVYGNPVILIGLNLYRMSKLFGSDAVYTEYGNCGADTCYGFDDSMLILSLLVTVSAPLILSMRIVVSVWAMPWSVLLYVAFSIGLGPMQGGQHIFIAIFYSSVVFFILVGVYRIEGELRRRWAENSRLKIRMLMQKRRLKQQRKWLWDLEERLRAFTGTTSYTPLDISRPATEVDPAEFDMQIVETDPAIPLTVPKPRFPVATSPSLKATAVQASPRPMLLSDKPPNSLLVQRMCGRSMDTQCLQKMSRRLTEASYTMREFFNDALQTFPELELFYAIADPATSSGSSPEQEYQRTIGALFAVYWLMRLDTDGKDGFCFGCEPDMHWSIKTSPARARTRSTQKREKFHEEMDWGALRAVVSEAVGQSAERLQAILVLTAFHDIMKVQALCPKVAPEHAPYQGYKAGDTINDHDAALAYVLEYYPDVLPSFRALPKGSRDVIIFTQGKLFFNHGWFVQAEAPPGLMLGKFKLALKKATAQDLAFYFFHWLTDLSGAEGQPLAGAEKFVLRFPRSVLSAFLWSIPFLQQLTSGSETEVVERYLEARLRADGICAVPPSGEDAIALMRLIVMAQGSGHLVPDAFAALAPPVRSLLAAECSRTGLEGQTYVRSPCAGGPALFVYYGPALLQRCTTHQEMHNVLQCMSAIFHAARLQWPLTSADSAQSVLLEAGALKAHMEPVLEGKFCCDQGVMVVAKKSTIEGAVTFVSSSMLNDLVLTRATFCAVDPKAIGWQSTAYVEEHLLNL